jgi:predicted membrane protein
MNVHALIQALGRSRLGFLVSLLLSAVLAKLTGYLPELSWWIVTSPASVGSATAFVVTVVRALQREWRNA